MRSDRSAVLALLADVAVVSAFVAIGRRSHDEAETLAGLVETAVPFVVGLASGWLVFRAWRRPASVRTGVLVWATTLVVGMVVRRVGFGDGTAVSFIVVAGLFLGLGLLGWRRGWSALAARRAQRPRHSRP